MRRSDQLGRLEQPREHCRTRLDGKKSITRSLEHFVHVPSSSSPRSVDYRYCSSRLPFLLHPHNWNISVQTCVPRGSFVCLLLSPFIFIPIGSCPVKVTNKMAKQRHRPLSWRKPGTNDTTWGNGGLSSRVWITFGGHLAVTGVAMHPNLQMGSRGHKKM